jgi:hypothetical protein
LSTFVSETSFWFPLETRKYPYYMSSCFSLSLVSSALLSHLLPHYSISETVSIPDKIKPSIINFPGSTVALLWQLHSNLSYCYWLVWYCQDSPLFIGCFHYCYLLPPLANHSFAHYPSCLSHFYRTYLRQSARQNRSRSQRIWPQLL